MSRHSRTKRRVARFTRVVVATLIISAMAIPFSYAEAQVARASAKSALETAMTLLPDSGKSKRAGPGPASKQVESPGEREARIASISLCPRHALMYQNEGHRVSPLPLDAARRPVQGIAFSYESTDKNIADVGSDGTVTALKPGVCFVTAVAGQARAKIVIEVRDGLRPRLTDAQWETEHANDCTDPERDPSIASDKVEIQSNRGDSSNGTSSGPLQPAPENDPPPYIPEAASRGNAVGHPRFSPDLVLQGKPTGWITSSAATVST